MRKVRWSIGLLLVFALLFSSLSVFAESGQVSIQMNMNEDADSDKTLMIAIGSAVVVGTVLFVVKTVQKHSHLKELYNQAELYANQGKWDLVVDTYTEIVEIKANYKDAQSKLEQAKKKAMDMFIGLGDQARAREQYDEAIELYKKAMIYQPTSITAKSKMDQVAQKLVVVHYRLGFNYETQNRWEEAFDEYSQAYYYNRGYQDLESRYFRAKAKVEGNLPLRALLFFVNHTEELGIERPLIQALHDDLAQKISDAFYMMDDRHVQAVVTEQAQALSDHYDQNLAIDLGKILGADEVLIGDIFSITSKGNRVRMEVEVKLINVGNGQVLDTIQYTYKFPKNVEVKDLVHYLPEMTKKLAEKIMD